MNQAAFQNYLATGKVPFAEDALPIARLGDHSRFDTHGVKGEKWIGFDLDGTLAKYDGWKGVEHIGEPIMPMVDLARRLHEKGVKVKIFTARVAYPDTSDAARRRIEEWCSDVLGFIPPVTCEKDGLMVTCFDDRSLQVLPNAGVSVMNALALAMKTIAALTDGYANCGEHQAAIDHLLELYLDLS